MTIQMMMIRTVSENQLVLVSTITLNLTTVLPSKDSTTFWAFASTKDFTSLEEKKGALKKYQPPNNADREDGEWRKNSSPLPCEEQQ